ncbi:MAG: glycerol-3-phosphate 1-O-acyltransferase PlsY [Spirochaetales bacterium]|nr:glycerol-3-phosphate 1-O-acyltransferase PlsY [Spirochaetales bacterium]
MIYLLLLSYLAGSFPSAVIITYIAAGQDIRSLGSGNAGATNVYRELGASAAVPVLLIDFLKAFIPVFFSEELIVFFGVEANKDLVSILMILFVMAGHVFPVWTQFRGGKAVAAAAGGISAFFPPAVPFCLAVFLITAVLSHYISLASLITAWGLLLFYIVYQMLRQYEMPWFTLLFFLIIPVLVTFLHRKNIKRLLKGEENSVTFSRKSE